MEPFAGWEEFGCEYHDDDRRLILRNLHEGQSARISLAFFFFYPSDSFTLSAPKVTAALLSLFSALASECGQNIYASEKISSA